MRGILRTVLILAVVHACVALLYAAEEDAPTDAQGWVPTRTGEPEEAAGTARIEPATAVVVEEAGPELPTELTPVPEIQVEPSPPVVTQEEVVTQEDFDNAVSGRTYNASGWYSRPDWGSMTWRPGYSGRFGEFNLEGASAHESDKFTGLSFTHGYGYHFLDGPSRSDMPPRVFDFNWGMHWFGEIAECWWADLAFSAGLYTDFEDSVREGWRFPAHAVLTWAASSEFQPVVGLRFFDRDNLGLLPVAGLLLRPEEGTRVELVFPEPSIAWRVSQAGDREYWLSLGGRIGGGEWAIERSTTDLADVVTYNSYQLVFAFSSVDEKRTVSSFEIGYVFDRDLEYRSGQGNLNLPETFFLRLVTRK